MMRALSRAGLAAALLCAPAALGQVSNPSLATAPDQPERIQPDYQERGVDGYAGPAASSSQSGQTAGTGVSGTASAGATVLQTYAGYVFGPNNGAAIATAPDSTLLSTILPASYLSNNNLSPSTTVGQLNANYAARLGSAANQRVLTTAS